MNAFHPAAPLLVRLFRAVLQASWQGALAIVLVLLARRVLGTRVPARWHYLLWFLVLGRLLVPAFMLPRSPASLENIPAVARPFDRQQPPAPEQKAPEKVIVAVPPVLSAASQVKLAKLPVALIPAATRHPWPWQAFAALVWLTGGVFLGCWLVVCALSLRRRVRRETFPVDAKLAKLWQACCRRWLRRAAPPILTADWVHSPALVGAWRPTLLLPRQVAASFSAQDWEHVFAHEIAHLRWRDHWTQLLLLAAWCVHWFNPVVWLGFRQLRADRELAADEWVLRHLQGDRALAYGETLFKTLAQRSAQVAFQPGLVGISEDGSQMKQRLRRIAAFLPGHHILGSLLGCTVVLVLGTVVLGQSSPNPLVSPSRKAAGALSSSAAPAALSVESVATEARKFSDDLLTAARAGEAATVTRLLNASFSARPARFSGDAATAMLDNLVRQQDLPAFGVLHDQLKQTSYGRDWQPSNEILASLVKDGRTNFLEALLSRRLDPARLANLTAIADASTAAWITRRVAEVVRQRADVETLGKAAGDGDIPAMQRLLDAGADINGYSQDDNTPLIRAVLGNHPEAAQKLLDHGAQVDKARYPGSIYTPLCLVNSVRMADLLKEHGANVHATLGEGVSILTYVARFADAQVVEWFLRQGLDPKMVDDDGRTLLFGLQDSQTAELLLKAGVDLNHPDKQGETALFSARSAAVVRMLIGHGAKVTGFEKSLLPQMAYTGSADAMEAAIQAGADHDPATLRQALFTAVHADDAKVVQMLVQYGANPNEPDASGDQMLPLTTCTIEGQAKAARALLEAGADPNGGKKPGWLLINAMCNGQREIAELLHEAGARGVSDLAYAVFRRDAANVKTLLASAPTYTQNSSFWAYAIQSAAQSGDVDTIRMALARGVPARPDEENDSYTLAAFNGQDGALVTLLAARQADDNPADLREALSEAVFGSHPDKGQPAADHFERCVRMLLDAGAPINGGKVSLVQNAAFTRYPGGNPTIVEMLVRAGADPNPMVNPEGQPVQRLLELVQEACAKGQCSVAVAETIARFDYLAQQVTIREAASRSRGFASTAASPDPTNKTDEPPAMFGHDISTTGTVSMADGTPLGSEEIMATVYSFRGTGGFMTSREPVENGSFPLRLDEHTTQATVVVTQKGCAAAFLGPFRAANMEQLNKLHVELTRGYTAAIQVVDQAGQPVAGAQLRPYYPGPSNAELPLEETTTNASGSAVLEHIGTAPLNIRVWANGFQADEATALHLDPARPYRLVLKAAQPLRGTVTANASGEAIAGAIIKLGGVRGPHDEDHYDPKQAPVLTTTDAQGRFVLASIRSDSRYYLFVEAPGYGGAYLRGVTLAQGELNVILGPELTIKGRIIHAPPAVIHLGKVYLQYGQSFEIGDNTAGQATKTANLRPVDGEADFSVGPFYKVYGDAPRPGNVPQPFGTKPVELYVDSWGTARFSIDQLPVTNFVFDLAHKTNDRSPPEPETAATPEKGPLPTPASSPSPSQANTAVPITAPKAKIIEVQATVATEDGAPIGYHAAEIHPSAIFGPSGMRDFLVFPSFNSPEGTTTMRIPDDVKDLSFAVTHKGYATAFAGPFAPPFEEKLKGLHFALTKGFTAELQIVDEEGLPVAGARVQSGYSKPLFIEGVETTTDDGGVAKLEHLATVPVDLRVRADGYQTDELDGIQLDPAKPYRWTLRRAQPLEGVVVAAATGQAIAGAKIKLAAVRGPHNETHADTHSAPGWVTSDPQGRFVLTSLRPDSRYFLFVEAPGYGGVLLRAIKTGQSALKVVLGPELSIKGRFLHVPATAINAYDQTFTFGYDQFFEIDGNFYAVGQQGRVTPKEGEADFTIDALYDNSVLIIAEGKETKLEARALPASDVVIDLAKQTSGKDGDELAPLPGTVTTGIGQKSR